jgi:hypothetical protein
VILRYTLVLYFIIEIMLIYVWGRGHDNIGVVENTMDFP